MVARSLLVLSAALAAAVLLLVLATVSHIIQAARDARQSARVDTLAPGAWERPAAFPKEHCGNGNGNDDAEQEMPQGWESCATDHDLFRLETLRITPNPPRRGKTLQVHLVGTLLEDIDAGTVDYTVAFGKVPILKDSVDLCSLLAEERSLPQCPLGKGKWIVDYTAKLSNMIPFGQFQISAKGWDSQGREIFCINGATSIAVLADDEAAPWEQQVRFTGPETRDG